MRVLRRYGNIQGTLWSLLLRSDCVRAQSLDEAAWYCRIVRKRLAGNDLSHIEGRLYLTEAELARQRGDVPAVYASLSKLRALLQNRDTFTRPPAMPLAHAQLVEAECARQNADPTALKRLRLARDAYAQIGARAFIARASVAIALVKGADMRRSRLLAHCRTNSYDLEVRRLTGVDTGFYPIHFV